MDKQEQVEKLIYNYKYYQDKLLQVSKKNRSVLLKKIHNKHNFDLIESEKLKEGVIEKITDYTIKNKALSVNILLDSIDNDDADAARGKLRTLSRNLHQIEEETGQQTGYIGFPFLQGHLNSDFYLRGPLVLFPISIEQKRQAKGGGWFVNISDNRPILNGALIAAIKKKGKYTLPENYEETFDEMIDEIISYTETNADSFFWDKINEWVKTIISLDESKNEFDIQTLQSLTKSDIDDLEEQKFHLVNYKIMGNFPQAEDEIFKDYNQLIEKSTSLDVGVINDLLDVTDSDKLEEESDDSEIKLDETRDLEINTVLKSDSSQDQIILEAKRTPLVAVRGPPGTGKSQVIVNLISDALSNGKKILVVCQKRAALDVVNQRLAKVGLDRYAVFLDKENDDRLEMYRQLYQIIEKEPIPLVSNQNLEEISTRIDQRVKFLYSLGLALRKPYFGGASAHKLYTKAQGSYVPVLDLSNVNPDIQWKTLDEFLIKLENLEYGYKKYEDKHYSLYGRQSFFLYGVNESHKLNHIFDKLLDNIDSCVLADSKENQTKLVSCFDTFLNNPGFMKRHRKKALKTISVILKNKPNESYISENFSRIKNGIEFWHTFETLLGFFDESKTNHLITLTENSHELSSFLKEMKNCLLEFDSIQQFDKQKQELSSEILEIMSQCREKMKLDDNWTKNIEQELYSYWIDKIESKNPILKGEPFKEYELKKGELERYMNHKRELVIEKIQYDIEKTIDIRDIYKRKRTLNQQQWRDFSAELKKKRRVKPVRKLFEIYSDQLMQIAPCWLSSPESVSKIFPLRRNLFDLVIVDEASQLAVERAIPLLYRAKHVVIAGDEHQLPPFDLFQVHEAESEEPEEISEEKSLLDLASIHFKTNNLTWHYRSKYQDLINFSNHAFYNGSLNVAPNINKDPKHPPIRWIKCNGIWDNNQNHVEVSYVLEELIKIWQTHRESEKIPSIGIITFNDSQKELILNEIDKLIEIDPEFNELYTFAQDGKKKDEQLFVKNIENVQGDERDIIIFSIGYAKNPDGKFANRFGPLSQKGGENRLNVAITRARQEMVIVSSIEPSEIKETSQNIGPQRLRQFLEYSKAVNAMNEESIQDILSHLHPEMERDKENHILEFDSDFEIQVHTALEKLGYKVDTQVGHSGYKIDLAVVHPNDPNRYVLAIECDGATFHSAKSAKERDVMRQQFLEGKGWIIERIWSRNWWKKPNQEIDRIDKRIKELVSFNDEILM